MPIPIGFDRGKVKWLSYCATGNHFHTVYWIREKSKFSTLHPKDEVKA